MRSFLNAIAATILERSAEELIGGVFLALALAMVSAGAYLALRSRMKDALTALTVLGLAANLAAMIVAATFVRMERKGSDRALQAPDPRAGIDQEAIRSLTIDAATRAVFRAADHDHDDLLSTEEAAEAAAAFVEEIGTDKPINREVLSAVLRERLRGHGPRRDRPRGNPDGPPGPPPLGPPGPLPPGPTEPSTGTR